MVFKIGFCNFAPLNLILTTVNRLKEYTIQFVGLEPGNHQFEFEVNDSFFEHFEFSLIQHGNIHVTVDLEKMERMMIFNIRLEGEVLVTCDRCTDEFNFPLSDTQQLIVKLGAEYMEESEDVVVIPETEYQFDLLLIFMSSFTWHCLPACFILMMKTATAPAIRICCNDSKHLHHPKLLTRGGKHSKNLILINK